MSKLNTEQIISAEQQLLEAMETHNIALLEKLLHDDLLFHTPDGSLVTKQMDLEANRSGSIIIEALTASLEKINLFNDTAIVSVLVDTKGIMMGKQIEGKFRYIRTWKMFDDGLKIIGGSCIKLNI